MSENDEVKPFMIIRSKRPLSNTKLKDYRNKFTREMMQGGLIMIPNDFEIFLIDPKTLKQIELRSIDYQPMEPTLWERIKRRFNHVRDK